MQKREFKDALNAMNENVTTKIQEYINALMKNGGKDLLEIGPPITDLDYSRTVLYAILHKVIDEFKPRNDKHQRTMDEVFRQLGIIYLVDDEPKRPEKKKAQRASKDRLAKATKPEADKAGTKDTTE